MRQMTPKKARMMMVVGMLSMCTGIILFSLVHPASAAGKDWLDGISGFFFGISIALNIGSFVFQKRLRHCTGASV